MLSAAAEYAFTLPEILGFLGGCGSAIGALGTVYWSALKRDQAQETRIKALEEWREKAEPRLKRLRDIELVRSSGGDVPVHTKHATTAPGDTQF